MDAIHHPYSAEFASENFVPDIPSSDSTKPSCWRTCFLTVIIERIALCVRDIFMAFVNIFRCSKPEDLKDKKIKQLKLQIAQLGGEHPDGIPDDQQALISELQTQNGNYERKIGDLTRQISQLQKVQGAATSDSSAEISALEEQIVQLRAEKAQMVAKKTHDSVAQALSDLKAKQAGLVPKVELESANGQIIQLRQQLADKPQAAPTAQSDNSDALQKAKAAQSAAESTAAQLQQQLTAERDASKKLQQAANASADKDQTIAKKSEEIRELQAAVKQAKAELAASGNATAMAEAEAEVARLDQENNQLKVQLLELNTKLTAAGQNKAGKVPADQKALQSRATTAEADSKREKARADGLAKELAAAKGEIQELQKKSASAATPAPKGNSSELESQVGKLKQDLADQQQRSQMEIDALKKKLEGLGDSATAFLKSQAYIETLEKLLTTHQIDLPKGGTL